MKKSNKKNKNLAINTRSQDNYQDQFTPYIQHENKKNDNNLKHNQDNYISINYGEI